ncbi:MAG: hypothetical protein AB2L20_11450 [Mangrovibacterium sp.]
MKSKISIASTQKDNPVNDSSKGDHERVVPNSSRQVVTHRADAEKIAKSLGYINAVSARNQKYKCVERIELIPRLFIKMFRNKKSYND